MKHYKIYGAYVSSEITLPYAKTCKPKRARPDIVIKYKDLKRRKFWISDRKKTLIVGNENLVYDPPAGRFIVKAGKYIFIDPHKETPLAQIQAVMTPLVATALHQKKMLTLHASAVEVSGKAVAFLGGEHWGKSTLAAALHLKGYPLITDDTTIVKYEKNKPVVHPGYPRFKLWPKSVEFLGKKPKDLPRLVPKFEKRIWQVKGGFSMKGLPLARVYVLGTGKKHSIRPLTKRQAFMEYTRHHYMINVYLLNNAASCDLAACTRLANEVPATRLIRKFSLRAMPSLIKLLEADFKAL